MRLIDADKLKEYMKEWDFIGVSCAIEAVDDMPTISQTNTAEWICYTDHSECSNCGKRAYSEDDKFCPNCGKRMSIKY